MYSLANSAQSFTKSWGGWGVHAGSWDVGDAGNMKMFDSSDAATVPAGDYVMSIAPDWQTSNASLKQMTIRVHAHEPVAAA